MFLQSHLISFKALWRDAISTCLISSNVGLIFFQMLSHPYWPYPDIFQPSHLIGLFFLVGAPHLFLLSSHSTEICRTKDTDTLWEGSSLGVWYAAYPCSRLGSRYIGALSITTNNFGSLVLSSPLFWQKCLISGSSWPLINILWGISLVVQFPLIMS